MENNNQNNLVSSKNQNNELVSQDISVLFAGDSYGLFVFKKTSRLVKAIYLLTNLMSDIEPMRERTRVLADTMLESSLSMSDRIWGEEIYQKKLLLSISETVVLFDTAESTRMISKMNHQIIVSELKKLANFLVTSMANYSSAKIAFEPNLFDGDYNYIPDQSFQTSNIFNGSTTGENFIVKDINKGQLTSATEKQKDVLAGNKSDAKTQVLDKTIKDKGNRQDIILSMLKSGVKLTVKDFAKNIKGCSEKTIQRELLNLVAKGVLKKEGERRWSKYFIVK